MPSRQNIVQRRKTAMTAMNDRLAVIAAQLGIDLPPISGAGPAAHNPEYREMVHAEQAAAALELITVALESSDKPEAIAALRKQIHDEFVASIAETSDTNETIEIDVEAAYAAFLADARTSGPEERLAFQDAVLGAFGVAVEAEVEATGAVEVVPIVNESGAVVGEKRSIAKRTAPKKAAD